MSDIRKVDNALYVNNEYLNSVLNGGNINFIADLHNSNLKSVQKKHGYIANYQIYDPKSEIKNTTSDIVIHFDHIRAHYKQDGIMTVTFAYIIKAILMHYIDTNKTIEINLVKSGEAYSIKKEVYFKFLPQKPSENSTARYEVFKPENNRLIENSKYRIVELPKKVLENRDKIYYEEMLLEDLIEVTKREVVFLYNNYQNEKTKKQIIEEALDNVNTCSAIKSLSSYYMGIENKSEDVLQCLSSLAKFRGTCTHLESDNINNVYKTFYERKQSVEITLMMKLKSRI